MRKILLLLVFFSISFFASAQNTWVQRLNFQELSPYVNTDSITGIRDIQISADGYLLVLGYIDPDCRQMIYKVSPNGAPILWSIHVGEHYGMTGEFTRGIYPTTDSGFVISDNPWGESISFSTYGNVEKYSKDGVLQWSHQFVPHTDGNPPYYDCALHDVIQNAAGNYYATVGDTYNDTLYEFDNSGNIIFHTGAIKGSQLYEMPNGDLLVQVFNDTLERKDTSGTLFWSVPSQRVLAFTSTHVFIIAPSGIQKVNTSTGSIMWTKAYPFGISSAFATLDGGFISVSGQIPRAWFDAYATLTTWGNPLPTTLCRVDSSGDTLWTRNFDFPHYGLSCVNQLQSGNIITGGAFIYTNARHEFFHRDYSAFITSLDSMGNGPLQTTTLTWPGDANDNQYVSFADDALYVSIALGDTGPARDTIDIIQGVPDYEPCTHSSYATDWINSFSNGVNHKHADYNDDGLIDTSDISPYSVGYYFPETIPQWRFGINPYQSSTTPDFVLKADRDTVAPGDSVKIYIIAGSSATPVDTLYGIAFSTSYNYYFISDTTKVNFCNSNLGTPGVDLTTYGSITQYTYVLNVLACRNNHLDVYNLANDTIGIITMRSSDTITTPQLLHFHISEFNALTNNQTPVNFNLIDGDVLILPGFLSVSEKEKTILKVFPNPVSDFLSLKNAPAGNKKIIVFNSLGECLKEMQSSETEIRIPVRDLPNGIFTLRVQSDQAVSNTTFVVQH